MCQSRSCVSQPNYEESRLRSSHYDKRNSDPQMTPIQWYEGLDECYDATKENDASPNTSRKVDIEDKSRHKQDRDTEETRVAKIDLLKAWIGSWALTSKVGVSEGIEHVVLEVKSIYMKYECWPNLVSIEHWMDTLWHGMTVCQNHVYAWRLKMALNVLHGRHGVNSSPPLGPVT